MTQLSPLLRMIAIALVALAMPHPASAQTLACRLTKRAGPPTVDVLTCDGLSVVAEDKTDVHVPDAGGLGSPQRALVEGGAAIVTVTPGRTVPFQVLTPRAIASVRGTRFAVDDRPDQTSIFVERGVVDVERVSGKADQVSLSAGQGVDVGIASGPLRVKRWSRARVRALMARLGH